MLVWTLASCLYHLYMSKCTELGPCNCLVSNLCYLIKHICSPFLCKIVQDWRRNSCQGFLPVMDGETVGKHNWKSTTRRKCPIEDWHSQSCKMNGDDKSSILSVAVMTAGTCTGVYFPINCVDKCASGRKCALIKAWNNLRSTSKWVFIFLICCLQASNYTLLSFCTKQQIW